MKKTNLNLSNTLFLCSGNIFRSPFSEIYFNLIAKEKGLDYFSISRGTNLFYSNPNSIVVKIAHSYGVELLKHTPKALSLKDIKNATAIFVMDYENRDKVMEKDNQAYDKLYNLGHFLDKPQDEIQDVKVTNIKENIHLVKLNFNLIVQAIDNVLDINI